jgi:pimeloyl-ACP methyl ester carboxylesterase
MGQGQPLVLLTGYAMTKEMWDADFLKALARHNRLLLMDYRGMGETPLGQDADISLRAMADDVARTLKRLQVKRAHVLGWSMGGMVAQELALEHPDRVCSLVLLNTAGDFASVRPAVDKLGAMPAQAILDSLFPAAWAREHPEALARVQPRPRPVDNTALKKYYGAMAGWEGAAGRAGKLSRPVLLLAGSEDWVCPVARSRDLFARFSEAPQAAVSLTIMDQGSHWMMHQFPEALAQAIQGFLSLHPCPRPPGS